MSTGRLQQIMFISIFFVAFFNIVCAVSKVKKVRFEYPVKLLPPITGTFFSTILTHDQLTCFGNRDYFQPTYFMTMLCMLPFMSEDHCFAVWGSRSIIIESSESVELLKLSTSLPHESMHGEIVPIDATRWLEIPSVSAYGAGYKEVFQIYAEPVYLCARSNDWRGGDAQFSITFRGAFLRDNDKRQCHEKTLMHIGVIFALSSAWLLPYVAAMAVAVFMFLHGLQIVLGLFAVSALVLCLAPLMLTRRNRHVARLYFNYFFTRISTDDTHSVIRRQLPVFQALFFCSALICGGSLSAYLLYYHGGVDREVRNTLLKGVLSVAVGWFVFFVCRSGERFFRDWLWLAMCVGLAQMMDSHINPLSRDKVVVAAMIISLLLLQMLVHLRRTSAAQSMERMVSPPMLQLAYLFGIRLSDEHHHRHQHKSLLLDSRKHSLRPRGNSSVPSPERIEGSNMQVCGASGSKMPSNVEGYIRLNVALLQEKGILGLEEASLDLSVVDCRKVVGLMKMPLHALGPLSFNHGLDQMFMPLLTVHGQLLKSLEHCCAAMCDDLGIIRTSVNSPRSAAISFVIELHFFNSSGAASFVQLVASGSTLDAWRVSTDHSFEGKFSTRLSLDGTSKTVMLDVQLLQMDKTEPHCENSLRRARGIVCHLVAALCGSFDCTVDATGLNQQFVDLAAEEGMLWESTISAQMVLSTGLLFRLGFTGSASFVFVVDSADVLARNMFVNAVLSAVGAALGVSLTCLGGLGVTFEQYDELGEDGLWLRVSLSVLLIDEQCLAEVVNSSHLVAWSLLLGGVVTSGSAISIDAANKALAVVVMVAILAHHASCVDANSIVLELFRLQTPI
jgi:hypothetical protein